MEKPVAVIVIYNIELEDSVSFRETVKRKTGMDVIVVDNSTSGELRERNEEAASRHKARFLSMQENIGLSRAYNLAIDSIRTDNISAKWIITLDQDTVLSEDYFESVWNAVSNPTVSMIHFPRVEAGGRLLSPTLLKSPFIKRAGNRKDGKNIVCINSGLLINMSLFESFRYNESLFLDMVDYDLFCSLAERREMGKISELGCTIHQDFSGAGFSGFEKDFLRFRIYLGDFKAFCKKWSLSSIFTYYILLKRAIRLTAHYRSIRFIVEIL